MVVFLNIILLLAPGAIPLAVGSEISPKKRNWWQSLLLWLLYDILIFGGCCARYFLMGRGFIGNILFSVQPTTESGLYIYRTDVVKSYALTAFLGAAVLTAVVVLVHFLRKRRGADAKIEE